MAAVVVVANEGAAKKEEEALEEVGALKKGPWTSAEDAILVEYVKKHGEGNWNAVQKHSGLFRCGKSCRLRWANHLRPNLKKGAFTPDEERIIMELHAKLGNKWARMAAQLPGRTDNEIKNYWNTRIKRRQRAGLPLYSPDIHLQGPNQQNHQSPANELSGSGGPSPHDHLPPHDRLLLGSEISHVGFDVLKPATLSCPSFSGLTDVSMNSVFSQTYSMTNPIQRLKRFRDNQGLNFFMGSTSSPFAQPADSASKNMQQPPLKARQTYSPLARRRDSFAQGFTYDPDPSFGGALTGSHARANGLFSASRSSAGLRPELPSSQFAESVPATVTGSPLLNTSSPFTPSPLPNQADACLSPNNSGLLEALLQEAQHMGGAKPHSSEIQPFAYSSYNNPMDCAAASQCKVVWGEDSDPITPLDGRTSSVFSESTPTLSAGPWEESSTDQSPNGIRMKSEEPNEEYISSSNCGDEDISTLLDFARPDVSLVPDWDNHNTEVGKEQSVVADALATVFNDEFGIDIQQLPFATSPPNYAWGLGSCPWNNMPGVC